MGTVKDCLHCGADDICTCMLMNVIISCQLLGSIVKKCCYGSYLTPTLIHVCMLFMSLGRIDFESLVMPKIPSTSKN